MNLFNIGLGTLALWGGMKFTRPSIELNEFQGRKYGLASKWYSSIPLPRKEINYLEIGCFHGSSVLSVLQTYGHHKNSKLYCIDPWEDYDEYPEYKGENSNNYDIFMKNISTHKDKNKIIPIRGYSAKEIPKFQDNFFDMIYIDGNHEQPFVYEDAVLSFAKLKKGGYLIFDDYDWEGVKLAVDEFQKKYPVRLLFKKKQVIFQK